jgi:hypothetical protein
MIHILFRDKIILKVDSFIDNLINKITKWLDKYFPQNNNSKISISNYRKNIK